MPRPAQTAPVDLVVTCFERTYREVLSEGFFDRLEQDNGRAFACRTALVNNVDDRAEAERLGQERVQAGGVDRVVFVADHLDAALARTGLTREDLEPVPYFTDWALVAVCLDGPGLVLHWDADVRLREPGDWVGPALRLLGQDPRVLVANPNWEDPTLEAFTRERSGPFALGPGFSDQVFLARRADLAAPVYRQRCLARWRYPFPDSFEARVDAHLRHAGRLRATYEAVTYLHPVAMGTSWPHRTFLGRAALAAKHTAIRVLRRVPWVLPPHLRAL